MEVIKFREKRIICIVFNKWECVHIRARKIYVARRKTSKQSY